MANISLVSDKELVTLLSAAANEYFLLHSAILFDQTYFSLENVSDFQ